MQNATNLRLCKNGCYKPLKPSSFLWQEKCTSHPGWTQRSPLPITTGLCTLPRPRTFNLRHKYEAIFTVVLLKAVKWPLRQHSFVLSRNANTPPTPPLPERPSPLQNLLQKQQKQSKQTFCECFSQAEGCQSEDMHQGHLQQVIHVWSSRQPAPSGEACRAPRWPHFGRQCASRASPLMTEWGLWDLSIIRNSPTRWRWWTWPAGAYPLGQCESVGLVKQEKANPFWIPSKQTERNTMGKCISRTLPCASTEKSAGLYFSTV